MARTSFFRVPRWLQTLLYRFSPLWLALFVALLLPPSREMLRFHIVSSEVAPQLYNWNQPWTSYGDDLDPLPLLKNEPNNAALALWNLRYQSENSEDYYSPSMYDDGGSNLSSQQLLKLSREFPAEIWLKGQALRAYIAHRASESDNYRSRPAPPPPPGVKASPPPKKEAVKIPSEMYRIVRDCAKLEPDNAFWPVCEAHFRAAEFNFNAANRLLTRAAKCSVYDDKSLETARNLIRVQSRFRQLSWEEKKVIYEDSNEESAFLPALTPPFQSLSNLSLQRDSFKQKLQTSVNLMRIGALMQRGNNSLATCSEGVNWQSMAWRLGNPARKRNIALPNGNRSFVEVVKKRGFPAIAKEALQLKRENEQRRRWMGQSNNESWGYTPVYLNEGRLAERANTSRDAGMVIVAYCGYLFLWWCFLNVFLFRGKGIASTKRERIVPVLIFGAIFIALGLWIAWWFSLRWNGTTPRSPRRDDIVISVALFAFFGLPFVLAGFCALDAMRRFKNDFFLPPRVDMELQLSALQRAFLRWLLPLTVICSVAMFMLGWLLFCAAVILDWGRFDLVTILPPDRNGSYGITGSFDFNPAQDPIPFLYGAFMCCVCLGVWFFKWRFFSPVALKPLTHTGLRRWKETLGMAIVSTVWIYILLAVCLWPTRRELERRMDKVLVAGPLSMAPKNVGNSS